VSRYAEASGRVVDEAAIRLYSARWRLDDLAIFLGWSRSAHRRTADTEKAWRDFASSLESDDL
jgi:spectinomycin phosphotransferase